MRRRIAGLVLLAVAGFGATGCSGTPRSPQATAPTSASHGPTTPSNGPTPASRQTVLPFTGLESPNDMAVDNAGNVYILAIHSLHDEERFPPAPHPGIDLA